MRDKQNESASSSNPDSVRFNDDNGLDITGPSRENIYTDKGKTDIPGIRIADYPQLSLITWSLPDKEVLIPEDLVLGLYERNWRYVDENALSSDEHALIDRLIDKYGNGVFHV